MSNLGSDGPSKMVATLRMPLEAWVKWDCAHVVPRVQQFLGVLPPKKEKKVRPSFEGRKYYTWKVVRMYVCVCGIYVRLHVCVYVSVFALTTANRDPNT